jgi:hypothetical protein
MSDTQTVETKPVEQTLARQENAEAVALTPIEMISSLVQRGADPSALEKVTAWAERMQANEARRAYAQAITSFKALCPTVVRHAKGHTNTYATLVDIDEQIRPVLVQCQLSPSWRVIKNDKEWIEVECRITHILGHSESTSFGGPPDRGPGRNELQARASTVSYLERYTLKALLGLVDKDMPDNDGADGAPAREPPQPPAPLTKPDPKEAEAKRRFRDIVLHKLNVTAVGRGLLKSVYEQVKAASGKGSVAECADWLASDDVLVSQSGVLSVVTDSVFGDPFADPQTPAAAKPTDLQGGADHASTKPQPPSYHCNKCGEGYLVRTANGTCLVTAGCTGKVVEV